MTKNIKSVKPVHISLLLNYIPISAIRRADSNAPYRDLSFGLLDFGEDGGEGFDEIEESDCDARARSVIGFLSKK